MTQGREGVVLPTVLLGLIGIGMVATGLIALTRTEVLSGRAALRYARSTVRARSLLETEEAAPRTISDLGHGFELIGSAPDGLGLTHFAVRWVLDPEVVAGRLPGAAEAAEVPSSGVDVSADCPSSLGRPATRRPAPAGPRVGPLDVDALEGLASELVSSSLPDRPDPAVFRTTGAPVVAGAGTGILVSGTDLVLGGTTLFDGLVVSAGSVHLVAGARVQGVVLAGGALTVAESAHLVGCVDRAAEAIRQTGLAGAQAVLPGGFLGRY